MKSRHKNDQIKPRGKRGKIIMLIFKIIILVMVVSMLVGAILQATLFTSQKNTILPVGQLIAVEDGLMHVSSMGEGKETIVLLPGMGIGLPSVDFAPLMRKLSEKYTVVVVEYFGVGFSSTTSIPRTSAQYVEEIRSALSNAGFNGPYVLMPHSISSVFSEYYASLYPDEIKAIISLDGTSTAMYEKMPNFVKSMLPIAKLQQAVGMTSLLARLITNTKDLLSYGYTEQEIKDMIVFSGFAINNTLLEQISESAEFVGQTLKLPFPASVPYFKVISKQTYEKPNKQLRMTPQEYQFKHLERIGVHARFEILEGSHFIYFNNVDRIVAITDEVLANTSN